MNQNKTYKRDLKNCELYLKKLLDKIDNEFNQKQQKFLSTTNHRKVRLKRGQPLNNNFPSLKGSQRIIQQIERKQQFLILPKLSYKLLSFHEDKNQMVQEKQSTLVNSLKQLNRSIE